MVKVYSNSNCHGCDKVKKYLKAKQIDFTDSLSYTVTE